MNPLRYLLPGLLLALVVSGCDGTDSTELQAAEAPVTLSAEPEKSLTEDAQRAFDPAQFTTIEWIDLMPQEDLDALINPPSYINAIEDGSAADQITSQLQSAIAAASDDRYQQALVSTKIVPEMDGKAIRLPGFIVPLEFNDAQQVIQFFLVPFFGACIHVPPPPPNQILFVDYPAGLQLENLYDPLWISGVLSASVVENDLATAAYTLEMEYSEEYTEDDY